MLDLIAVSCDPVGPSLFAVCVNALARFKYQISVGMIDLVILRVIDH